MKQVQITLYIPDEFNFIAQDYNGEWWAFEKEPFISEDLQAWDQNIIKKGRQPMHVKLTEPTEDMNIVSWRETLTKI